MPRLLSCSLCKNICTMKDLYEANDNAVKIMPRLSTFTICLTLIGINVMVILIIETQYADNTYYLTSIKRRRNTKNIVKVENRQRTYVKQNITIILNDDSHDSIEMEIIPKIWNENHHYGSPDKQSMPTILQNKTNSFTNIIHTILEKARLKIKKDTYTYNFSQSGVNVLEDLVMESGGQPLRSLIVSTWRSGSTFLVDLINNAAPSTYYHCEPLLMYGTKQFRTPKEATEALNIVKRMLKCNYEDLEDYFEFERNDFHGFSHISRQWEYCKNENTIDLCFNPEVISRLCQLFPFQNIKLVRLRLRVIEEILEDNTLNVKVILLVRDPRGVMQSRRDRPFCRLSPDCFDPSMLCADMVSDNMAAGRLLQQYRDRLMVMRFEELALQPNITTDRILRFLKIQRTQAFDDFLQSHTNVEVAGPYSTSKFSRNVPYKWRTALDFNYVNKIQKACRYAMNLWGYKMAHNETHMTSKDFNPIEDYTIQ